MASRLRLMMICIAVLVPFSMARAADEASSITALLASRCLDCHSGDEAKGGLDLTTAALARQGGESGPAIDQAKPLESLLWERVSDNEMPPKKPLSSAEKNTIRQWLASGARWPAASIDRFSLSTSTKAGYDWWAFRPLKSEFSIKHHDRNPIDQFIDARLNETGLKPNPAANPRDLIRRLAFDLTGLPPENAILQNYITNPTPENYLRIANRMLASPRYGERWARHWLDVVRYGESTGFERNAPNHILWPYRDWVISALNNDMPYDEFVRRQVAGDLLDPGPSGAAASGFMVAGIHNTVIGVSERMRLLARQDELEENIGVLGQAFLGLTVQCARCHDHKFDPISSREYYSMVSAIDGVQHGERSFPDPNIAIKMKLLDAEIKKAGAEITSIENIARNNRPKATKSTAGADFPKPFAMWTFDNDLKDSAGNLHGQLFGNARLEGGALVLDGKSGYMRTATMKRTLGIKTFEAWVMSDNLDQRGGGVVSLESDDGSIFDAIVFGEQELRRWMPGSDGFSRTVSFQGPMEDAMQNRPVHIAIVYEKDGTITCYRDGRLYGLPVQTKIAKFPLGQTHIAIGLRHLPAGGNKHFQGRVLRACVYDRPLKADEISKSAGREGDFISEDDFRKILPADQFARRTELQSRLAKLQKELTATAKESLTKIYAIAPRQNPGPMKVHLRGDVVQFGPVVNPSGLKLAGQNADWKLNPDSTDADRRLQLARWITSRENPLFARVIVNRIWHYHFGTGIVDTPNDFGFNGGRPSHPELLDFLARYLIDNHYQMKSLHRLIVSSDAYKRSSAANAENIAKDAGNRLLWRHNPTRLEGEVLRDSMLAISRMLNQQMGGPGFIDVTIDNNNGTTYYEPLDPVEPEFQRRTIYRFSPRGGRSTLLDTFDCPDPSTTSPRRNVTTTPLQALSLMHGPFTVRMAESLATKIQIQFPDSPEKQVNEAWQQLLQRAPDRVESEESLALLKRHGLWAVCLGLLNTNEFVIAR